MMLLLRLYRGFEAMPESVVVINPATEEQLEEVPISTAESIANQVERARNAQPAFAKYGFAERAAMIARFADSLERRRDELARVLTMETGKPIGQSQAELKGLAERLSFFLSSTEPLLCDQVVADGATREVIVQEPLGTIANISAWNYPYFVGANVFVPALLTGNAVIYKPSEYATLTGLRITECLHQAGFPEDVFQLVVGAGEVGRRVLGEALDGVYFTGSYATGKHIAESVAGRLIRVQLELGGKDPAYVRADVSPEIAAQSLAEGAFYNAGQSCCAVERIYVHNGIYERFVEAFVAQVKALRLGDPLDAATDVGPLARREAAIEHLKSQLHDAEQRNARVLCGGRAVAGHGFFFEPTVVVDLDHEAELMRAETFGPAIGIMAVASDGEALQLMADTPYGLTAAIYTADEDWGRELLTSLNVGSAYVNCCDRVSPRLPWSGRGHSGLGCTLSTYGIQAFVRQKAFHLRGL